ncbi:FeoA family protein [Vallitaleaceae bacterium 9-2]
MDNVVRNNKVLNYSKVEPDSSVNSVADAQVDVENTIKMIDTTDVEMKDFLFTLGCYEGEKITVISRLADNIVISLKDARYSIDTELASAIRV